MSGLKQILSILPEPLRDSYLSYKHAKQLENWKKKACPIPTPHIAKQIAINFYQYKYNVEIFIETGTYLGDMVYAQRKHFKKLYTIELSESLYLKARKRLKKYTHIEVMQGDSGVVLETIVGKLNKQAIFWLDGHYSGGITAMGDKQCPVIQELNIILKSPYQHVILIDDAREFNGTNDYPTMQELESAIQENGKYPNSIIEVRDDIIRVELKA